MYQTDLSEAQVSRFGELSLMPTDDKHHLRLSRINFLSKINPLDLELVSRCAQVLNLRKAADDLDSMLESAASRRLRRIEMLLGTRLFDRTTRSMSLSNDGERIIQQIDHVIAALDELRLLCEELEGDVAGRFALGASPVLAELLAKQLLPQFLERFPKIQLRLQVVTQPEINRALEELDLVIHPALPSSEAVGIQRLTSMQVGFYASAGYLKKHGTPQHPRELVAHRMIISSGTLFSPTNIPWEDKDGMTHYIEPLEIHTCNSMSAVMSLVCQQAGVTLIPKYLHHFYQQELCLLFDGQFAVSIDIYALYPSARLRPRRVAVFLETLHTAMRNDPLFQ